MEHPEVTITTPEKRRRGRPTTTNGTQYLDENGVWSAKLYREINKQKNREKAAELSCCQGCGAWVRHDMMGTHKKSARHAKIMAKLTKTKPE